jgi:D-arabinose 1-dehydrogenase-like Zn-dependent alcohol dehydrogenase
MKAAVLYEIGKPLCLEELEMPQVGNDEVLIKVAACGVCHTDLTYITKGRPPYELPGIVGHEISGTVEDVGAGQKSNFKSGDRVIVGMRYKCGTCRYCVAGRDNLCRQRPLPSPLKTTAGRHINRWNVGGFAEYLVVPGYMIFGIPEQVSLQDASVIGCRVTTAYNAVKHGARLEPGESALVVGCGGVGLNTLQFLRCFGAYPIIAVDINDEKLAAAKKFGATHVINASTTDPVKEVKKLTDGGVDKSFEAIGNPKTADQVVMATAAGGTAVIIGGLGGVPITISDGRFAMNEIKVTGVASRRANDVREVLQMVADNRILVKDLITREYPYDQLNRAFEDLEHGRYLMGITLWN